MAPTTVASRDELKAKLHALLRNAKKARKGIIPKVVEKVFSEDITMPEEYIAEFNRFIKGVSDKLQADDRPDITLDDDDESDGTVEHGGDGNRFIDDEATEAGGGGDNPPPTDEQGNNTTTTNGNAEIPKSSENVEKAKKPRRKSKVVNGFNAMWQKIVYDIKYMTSGGDSTIYNIDLHTPIIPLDGLPINGEGLTLVNLAGDLERVYQGTKQFGKFLIYYQALAIQMAINQVEQAGKREKMDVYEMFSKRLQLSVKAIRRRRRFLLLVQQYPALLFTRTDWSTLEYYKEKIETHVRKIANADDGLYVKLVRTVQVVFRFGDERNSLKLYVGEMRQADEEVLQEIVNPQRMKYYGADYSVMDELDGDDDCVEIDPKSFEPVLPDVAPTRPREFGGKDVYSQPLPPREPRHGPTNPAPRQQAQQPAQHQAPPTPPPRQQRQPPTPAPRQQRQAPPSPPTEAMKGLGVADDGSDSSLSPFTEEDYGNGAGDSAMEIAQG